MIAFATAESVRRTAVRRSSTAAVAELPNDHMDPLFQAVAEATEEAIINSLLQAQPVNSALKEVQALDPEIIRQGSR